MKVGDKVKRLSTLKYNDVVGTVVEVQGSTIWVNWGGLRVSGPNQPYPIPESDLMVVESTPDTKPPVDDKGDDKSEKGGGGANDTPQAKPSKIPVVAGIAIAALLLLRGAK